MIERFHIESAGGVRIAVRTFGDPKKPALVLCNGIGCTEGFWTEFVSAIGDDYFVVDWSMRAHYDSTEPDDPQAYRVEDHASDLEALCQQLGLERAVFVGFSLGVMVCLEHYRRHPERHRAMVLISGTPRSPFDTLGGPLPLGELVLGLFRFGRRVPALSRWVMQRGLDAPWAVPLGKRLGFIEPHCPEAPCRAYLQRLAQFPPRPYLTAMLAMARYSAVDLLPQVRVPVLVVAGTHDNMAPSEVMAELVSELPDAEMVRYPGGSHTLLLTYGARIGNDVQSFVRRRAS